MTAADTPAADPAEPLDPASDPDLTTAPEDVTSADEVAADSEDGTAAPEEAKEPTEVERLGAQITKMAEELLEVRKQYHAALQEFENSKARIERQAQKEVNNKLAEVIGPLLDVADNLDRAVEAGEAGQDGLLDGVKLVQKDFLVTLGKSGVRPMDSMGQFFDPGFHDAVSFVPVPDPALHKRVVGIVKKGYLLGDVALRAATVAVGNHEPPAASAPETAEDPVPTGDGEG